MYKFQMREKTSLQHTMAYVSMIKWVQVTDTFKLDSSEEACVTKWPSWSRFFKKSCGNVYVVCKCSVYMYSHVYECRHACTMAPVGRSEDNYGYQSKTIHVFWDRVSSSYARLAGLGTLGDSLVSTSHDIDCWDCKYMILTPDFFFHYPLFYWGTNRSLTIPGYYQ